MTDEPTVYIVDSDEPSRRTIRKIVEEMGVRTKEYMNAEAFLAEYDGNRPGCVVAEFRLLGMNGVELQRALQDNNISLPVIFVAARPETHLTVLAMRHGAVTVLQKPFSPQDLWDNIREALAIDRRTQRIDDKHTELHSRLARLTRKERQVLHFILQGKMNKAIAKQLQISQRTVEHRRHQIFKKTETESLAALIRLILQSSSEDDITRGF